jgi:exodeoxyribonuclease-1
MIGNFSGLCLLRTETTGTSIPFDQILQFGAILTDANLNELERFEIRCRILPWVVPNPYALLTTGISPSLLTDPDLPSHFEMVGAIEGKLLEWAPARFCGYNSISFDENLLRQAFFQTLRFPYLTTTRGNGRADILTMARACAVHAPQALSFPLDEEGRRVFRLDQLAPANGFDHSNAHDAMADVEATIHIAKLIRTNGPGVWSRMLSMSSKDSAASVLESEPVLIQSEFFQRQPSSWLVTWCGHDPDYVGRAATFDLSEDPTGSHLKLI